MRAWRPAIVVCLLLLLLAVCFPVGLLTGSVDIGLDELLAIMSGEGDSLSHFVVIETHLPALLTALFAGAALARHKQIDRALLSRRYDFRKP